MGHGQAHGSWQSLKESLARSIDQRASSYGALRCLHSRTISSGLHPNLYISSLLVAKYFRFGDAGTARKVFDAPKLGPAKPLLWNSLIKGYLLGGSPRLALDAYLELTEPPPPPPSSSSRCEPDKQTFLLAITACTHLSEFELGCRLGDRARRSGSGSDLLVATALVAMHAKAGRLETARDLFDGMRERDAAAYNAMISGYSRHGHLSEAVDLFGEMRAVDGVSPTEASFVSVISGLGGSGLLQNGQAAHATAVKAGFETNQNVSNSLLGMYVACGDRLEAATKLFDCMALKDALSWSTMIGGYVKHERPRDALELFQRMVSGGRITPTRPILLNALLACADLGNWQAGRWIEECYLKNDSGGLVADAHLITALIYMYAKSGQTEISLGLLENVELVRSDVVAWNATIKACAERNREDRVLELTRKMQRNGVDPDPVTFLELLRVVSSVPLPRKGMETHAQVVKRGFESERTIANSLIDIYAKSGYMGDSCRVFGAIQEKDVVSWSCMIKAFAQNGDAKGALDLFHLMGKSGLRPNSFTFLAALSACSHAGFAKEGRELLESMEREYGVEPGVEHLACMVDIFCRAGLLKDAYLLLQSGIRRAWSSAVLWGTLLSACRLHGDVVIGEAVAKHLFLLEPRNAANYLTLAGIYISEERREDANGVLSLLRTKGLEKQPGYTRLEGDELEDFCQTYYGPGVDDIAYIEP